MKVVVLGAGVVGTTASWYLRERGLEVEVIDRQSGPGLETSYANGGQLAASHAGPWASPKAPLQILKWLGKEDAPLLLRPRLDPQLITWGLRFLRNCTDAKMTVNMARAARVGLRSLESTIKLRDKLGLDYHQQDKGILQIFKTKEGLEEARHHVEWLKQFDIPSEIVDRDRILDMEPALSASVDQLTGAFWTPLDQRGDAYAFTTQLAQKAAEAGVTFTFNATINRLTHDGMRITGIETDQGVVQGDAYLVCLASQTPLLLKPLGLSVPIYPCKGYSVTMPVTDADRAPHQPVSDENTRMVYTRFGDKLRVAGTAEVTGYDTRLRSPEPRIQNLIREAEKLFPNAVDKEAAEEWTGLRPVTPDSVPILGATRYTNLYLNVGHGVLGWTMACGSGETLAALIAGDKPPISLDGLGLERF